MFKKLLLFLVFITILFGGCVNETSYNVVKANDQYFISIPSYFQPCFDLHHKASLQYKNENRDIYAIVIDEKKASLKDYKLHNNLQDYYNSVISNNDLDSIKHKIIDEAVYDTINGNKAITTTIKGLINNRQIIYKLAFIETPDFIYQIVIWTRRELYHEVDYDINSIIESFRES